MIMRSAIQPRRVTFGPILLQLTCITTMRCFSTCCLALQGYLRDVCIKVS